MKIKAIQHCVGPIVYVFLLTGMIGNPTGWVRNLSAQETDTGGGDVIDFGSRTNIIRNRVTAASDFVDALGEYLEGEGEFLMKEAMARKKMAEAVDMELDNWKKHVTTYYERRSENMRGQMKKKELYQARADQILKFRDNRLRRMYESIKNHPERGGGQNVANLNFLLDRFVGTPLGYGYRIEDIQGNDSIGDRWDLNPEILHQLQVKTSSRGQGSLVFRLDEPKPIGFEWPGYFLDPQYDAFRETVESLSEELGRTTNPKTQLRIVNDLDNAFAALSQHFYQTFSPQQFRLSKDKTELRRQLRADQFLDQKHTELALFRENPGRAIELTSRFNPVVDGKNAATLVTWMNRNGMQFASPEPGDEASYNAVMLMMLELYSLLGEPIQGSDESATPGPDDQIDFDVDA